MYKIIIDQHEKNRDDNNKVTYDVIEQLKYNYKIDVLEL